MLWEWISFQKCFKFRGFLESMRRELTGNECRGGGGLAGAGSQAVGVTWSAFTPSGHQAAPNK